MSKAIEQELFGSTGNYLDHLEPKKDVPETAKVETEVAPETTEAAVEVESEQSEEANEAEALVAAETDEPVTESAPEKKRDKKAEARIAKLIAERERLRGQVDMLTQHRGPAPVESQAVLIDPNAPNPANYVGGENDVDFKVDVKLYQRDIMAKQARFKATQMEVTAKYPDMDELIDADAARVRSGIPTANPTVVAMIHESDNAGELWHYLLAHPDEAIQIARMDPVRTAKAIGRIESKLEMPEPQKQVPVKKTAPLPAPINPSKANKPNTSVGAKNFGFTEY